MAQTSSHLQTWDFPHSSFGDSQECDSKIADVSGKILNKFSQQKRCHHKAVPIFSRKGLLKPKSPHSWTSLLQFHTSFSIKKLVGW